jgi:hypothetical protein
MVERMQGISLATAEVVGAHELTVQPFPQWVRRHQCDQLGNQIAVLGEAEPYFDLLLQRANSFLDEPRFYRPDESGLLNIGEGLPAPESESLAEQLGGQLIVSNLPGLSGQCAEPVKVDVLGLDREHISRSLVNYLFLRIDGEHLSQLRNAPLDSIAGGRGSRITP